MFKVVIVASFMLLKQEASIGTYETLEECHTKLTEATKLLEEKHGDRKGFKVKVNKPGLYKAKHKAYKVKAYCTAI